MDDKTYKYPLGRTLLFIVPAGLLLLLELFLIPPILFPQCFNHIISFLSKELSIELMMYVDRSVSSLIFPVLASFIWLATYNEIQITDKTLRVRIFIFFWRDISWNDVVSLSSSPMPGASDIHRWCFIKVERLTVFHRLVSLGFWVGIKPSVVLYKQLRDYEELLNIIQTKVDTN